jgi:hypothetical protein
MHIEFKGKRENEQKGMIQTFYDSFDDLFNLRLNKKLVRNRFDSGHKKSHIHNKIQEFTNNGQVACNHDWGRNGLFIFQIDLLYFDYKNMTYSIGFQFQNSTAKINCAKQPYISSSIDEIADMKPIFKKMFYNNGIYNSRIGYPKAHAYISITRKDETFLTFDTHSLVLSLFDLLENSANLINNIKQEIMSINGIFLKYHSII